MGYSLPLKPPGWPTYNKRRQRWPVSSRRGWRKWKEVAMRGYGYGYGYPGRRWRRRMFRRRMGWRRGGSCCFLFALPFFILPFAGAAVLLLHLI